MNATGAHNTFWQHLSGPISFDANWSLAAQTLATGQFHFDGKQVEARSWQLALHTGADSTTDVDPAAAIWSRVNSTESIAFNVDGTSLNFGNASIQTLFDSRRNGASLRLDSAFDLRQSEQPTLAWPGTASTPWPANRLTTQIDFEGAKQAVVAAADLVAIPWVHFDGIAAEFSPVSGSPIVVASNEPLQPSDFMRPPVAARFVLPSLPGCDAAMFVARGSANSAQVDVRNFSRREIPLDDFDLILKRIVDGLYCTVRFRGISLCYHVDLHMHPSGWSLIREEHGEGLIEFDLGSQHLLEEAVYFTEWCVDCTVPPPDTFPVADEVAALSLRRRIDAGLPTPNIDIPQNQALLSLQALIAELRAKNSDLINNVNRWDAFRASADARWGLTAAAPCLPTKYVGRFEAATSTHLTFQLATGRLLPVTMRSLFSWATDASGTSSRDHGLTPVLTKLRAKNDLIVTRPLSLAASPDAYAVAGTSIEAPARLVMSPAKEARWLSTPLAPADGLTTRVEGWSVRLEGAKLTAVFSPDVNGKLVSGTAQNPIGIEASVFRPPDPYKPTLVNVLKFRASMDDRDRHELVVLTSLTFQALCGSKQVECATGGNLEAACTPAGTCDPNQPSGWYRPQPIDAKLMLLSSHGATFKYEGFWDPPAGSCGSGALSVTRYNHYAQSGRDCTTRIEYKGFLFPLGHPAVLIKLTDRRFCLEKLNLNGADVLQFTAKPVQRFFIHVPAFVRTFPAIGQPHARLWGHSATAMASVTTPSLRDPNQSDLCELSPSTKRFGSRAFWPQLPVGSGGVDVLWDFFEPGGEARYSAPLLFVDNTVAHAKDSIKSVVDVWRAATRDRLKLPNWDALPVDSTCHPDPNPASNRRYFAIVSSALLPYLPNERGENTEIETSSILLGVAGPGDIAYQDGEVNVGSVCVSARMEGNNQPPFYPVRRRAEVASTQIAALTGGSGKQRFLMEYDATYLRDSIGAPTNAAEIFGVFVNDVPKMDFGADTSKSGGFVSPSARIVWASKRRGLIGGDPARAVSLSAATAFASAGTAGPNAIEPGHGDDFNPKEYFASVLGDAKLLGVVRLVDVLDVVLKASGPQMPTTVRQNLFDLSLAALRTILPAIKTALRELDQLFANASSQSDATTAVALARLRPFWNRVSDTVARASRLLAESTPSDAAVLKAIDEFGSALTALSSELKNITRDPVSLLPGSAGHLIREVRSVIAAIDGLLPPKRLKEVLTSLAEEFVRQQAEPLVEKLISAIAKAPAYRTLLTALVEARSMIVELRETVSEDVQFLQALQRGLLGRVDAALSELKKQISLVSNIAESRCTGLLVGIHDRVTVACGIVQNADTNGQQSEAVMTAVNSELDRAAAEIANAALPGDLAGTASQLLSAARLSASRLSTSLAAPVDAMHRLAKKATDIRSWMDKGGICSFQDNISQKSEYLSLVEDGVDIAIRGPQRAFEQLLMLSDVGQSLDHLVTVSLAKVPSSSRPPGDLYLERLAKAAADPLRKILSRSVLTTASDSIKALLAEIKNEPTINAALGEDLKQSATDIDVLVALLHDAPNGLLTLGNERRFVAALKNPNPELVARVRGFASLGRVTATVINAVRGFSPDMLTAAARATLRQSLLDLSRLIQGRVDKLWKDGLREAIVAFHDGPAMDVSKSLKRFQNEPVYAYLSAEAQTSVANLITALARCVDLGGVKAVVDQSNQMLEFLARSASTGTPGNLVNFEKIVDDALSELGVPSRLRIQYDWDTQVQESPKGNDAIFEPRGDRRLTLSAVVEASLRGGKPSATLDAQLSEFAINLFGKTGLSNFLTIEFSGLSLKARPGTGLECKAEVTMVTPGAALGFVKSLSDLLGGSSGFVVLPRLNGIRVGYEFAKEQTILGGFLLQNIAFSVFADLPFDNSPVRTSLQLATKEKPFLISLGVYGGGGFLALRTRADTLELLEASFEYGAMIAFAFGPLKGSGRVTAGIYIRMGGRDPVIEGFFCAAGEVSIAGIIRMGAMLRVSLTYHIETGQTSGDAQYTFKFSIGFFDYSYSVNVAYAKQGDDAKGQPASGSSSQRQRIAQQNRLALLSAVSAERQLESSPGAESTATTVARLSPMARHRVDAGLLKPYIWQRYWAAFEQPADGETQYESTTSSAQIINSAAHGAVTSTLSDAEPLRRIEWYVVPWGARAADTQSVGATDTLLMRLSLRIVLGFIRGDLRTEIAQEARRDWPRFLMSIESLTLHLSTASIPISISPRAFFAQRLKSWGLSLEQASELWCEVFPLELPLGRAPEERKDHEARIAIHESAELANLTECRVGATLAASLDGFFNLGRENARNFGAIFPRSASHRHDRMLTGIAAIYKPITSAKYHGSVVVKGEPVAKPQGLAATVSKWKDQVLGISMSSGIVGADIDARSNHTRTVPYSSLALDHLDAICSQSQVAGVQGKHDLKLDAFSKQLAQRQLAYASDTPRSRARPAPENAEAEVDDFRRRLAGIAAHPWLSKVLGLVLDVETSVPATSPDAEIWVNSWATGKGTMAPKQLLKTKMSGWFPAAQKNSAAPQARGTGANDSGLVNLASGCHILTQVDIDRTPERLLQTALAYRNEVLSGRPREEIKVSVQPQETVGLSLVDICKLRNPPKGLEPDRRLYAEHLVIGFRPDVQRCRANQDPAGARLSEWTSLCARTLQEVSIRGRDITHWFSKVGTDEAMLVERVRTVTYGDGSNETSAELIEGERFRWDIWGLGAPRPDAEGASADGTLCVAEGRTSRNQMSGLEIKYAATAGATEQRFGSGYRVGLRQVMIDGNSVSLPSAASGKYSEKFMPERITIGDDENGQDFGFAPFLRFEPVSPPTALLVNHPDRKRFPKVGVRRAVVASGLSRDTSCERFNLVLVPPRCASVDLAIRHGMLDRADFRQEPPASAFPKVVLTDHGNFPSERFAFTGLPDPAHSSEDRYFRAVAIPPKPPTIPFYPDPWAKCMVLGFYRAGDDRLMYYDFFESHDETHQWPMCRALKLELMAVPSVPNAALGFSVSWSKDGNTMTVRIAPAVRLTLRAWYQVDDEQLNSCGVVDQIATAAADPSGDSIRCDLGLGDTATVAEAQKVIVDRLSNWSLLNEREFKWFRSVRPSDRPSKFINFTSFWMINPCEEIELLHAVALPIAAAEFSESDANLSNSPPAVHAPGRTTEVETGFGIVRRVGETSATFLGDVRLHRLSTSSIDAVAFWQENPRVLSLVKGKSQFTPEPRQGALFQLQSIAEIAADTNGNVPVKPMPPELGIEERLQSFVVPTAVIGADGTEPRPTVAPYDFGDTKARVVDVELRARSRNADEFATQNTYVAGDDVGPHTLVSPRKRVIVASTERPAPAHIEYVAHLNEWSVESSRGGGTTKRRKAGWFRVWMGPDWYSRGNGELLALVCWHSSLLDPAARRFLLSPARATLQQYSIPNDAIESYVTRWGLDPLLHEKAAFGNIPASALKNRLRSVEDLARSATPGDKTLVTDRHHLQDVASFQPQFDLGMLPETPMSTGDRNTVLALYRPNFDPSSHRWYADIQIDPGHAYKPFVRLAFARYQPHGLKTDTVDLRLSTIVATEFVQLTAERSLTVVPVVTSHPSKREFDVTIAGTMLHDAGVTGKSRTRWDVCVEEQLLHMSDGAWLPAATSSVTPGRNPVISGTIGDVQTDVWKARAQFETRLGCRYSLALTEYEILDDGQQNGLGRSTRLVYFDRVALVI